MEARSEVPFLKELKCFINLLTHLTAAFKKKVKEDTGKAVKRATNIPHQKRSSPGQIQDDRLQTGMRPNIWRLAPFGVGALCHEPRGSFTPDRICMIGFRQAM